MSVRSISSTLAGVFVVVLAAPAVRAAPAGPVGPAVSLAGISSPEPSISLTSRQKSLAAILYQIFQQTNLRYQVRAQVGAGQFSLDVSQEPLSRVLARLSEQYPGPDTLVFSHSAGTVYVDREYVQLGPVNGEYRISAAHARLARVLGLVFDAMHARYRVEPDVPAILLDLQLRPAHWEDALPAVLQEASRQDPTLTYSLDGDTYVVHRQRFSPVGPANKPGARPVTLSLRQVPLRDALIQLLAGSALSYRVSEAVPDVLVTYSSSGEPEIAALRGLLRVASRGGTPVTYREARQLLYIEPGALPGELGTVRQTQESGTERVAISAVRQRLRLLAAQIGAATGSTVLVAPNVPDLPVSLAVNATLDEALLALLGAARTSLPALEVRKTQERTYLFGVFGKLYY